MKSLQVNFQIKTGPTNPWMNRRILSKLSLHYMLTMPRQQFCQPFSNKNQQYISPLFPSTQLNPKQNIGFCKFSYFRLLCLTFECDEESKQVRLSRADYYENAFINLKR